MGKIRELFPTNLLQSRVADERRSQPVKSASILVYCFFKKRFDAKELTFCGDVGGDLFDKLI